MSSVRVVAEKSEFATGGKPDFYATVLVHVLGDARALPSYRSCTTRMRSDPSQRSASKFLSLVLRHDSAAIGLVLDDAGWVEVDVLL